MRRLFLRSLLFGLVCVSLVGVGLLTLTSVKASVEYGNKRPFSFYYPYNYKFYYPHPQYHAKANSCYWLYTNGTYVYYCE